MNREPFQPRRKARCSWAGKQISTNVGLSIESVANPSSPYDGEIADIALVSADGTSIPIYNGQNMSGQVWNTNSGGVFNPGYYSWDATPNTHFHLGDHLGTAQMEFSWGGWPVWQGQFAPFGAELQNGASLLPGAPDGSTNKYKFTGKERDSESGLDYFGARYYASSMGRWMSPDTIANLTPANPQGWNKYAYTFNNPLTMTDPTGNWPTYVHNRIIDNVFGYLLTDSQRDVLKSSSKDVDGLLNGNQNPGNAFKHSQRAANLSATEGGDVIPDIQDERTAAGLADNFVEMNLGKAVDAQLAFEASPQYADGKSKTSNDALWYFGQALHTRTDASSPWHDNFKTSWGPGNPFGSAMHVIGEFTLGGLQFGSEYEAEYAAQTLWSQYQDRLIAARARRVRKQPVNKK